MYNPFSLSNKTVFVTGTSSGIGRATAIECSKMGANVIISGRNETRLNETLNKLEGEGHLKIDANLSKEEGLDKVVDLAPGNTVSSTIPIALKEAEKKNKLHGNILLAGFGVGYSWGDDIKNSNLILIESR